MSALLHLGQLSTGHETVGAGNRLHVTALQETFGADPFPALHRSFRPVLGRKSADRIHDGDEHRGPVFFIQGDDRLDLCPFLEFLSQSFQCRWISGLTPSPAMEGDPFQPLRSQDSPDPRPAKGATVLAFDHGKSDEVFSGRSDDHGPGFLLPYYLEDSFFSFISFFSPEPPGRVKDHVLVADFEKNGIL